MYLKQLTVSNLRNHSLTTLAFCENFNILLGDNGQGKTTLLEAVSLICHSRSFHSPQDRYMVKQDSEGGYSVSGKAMLDNGAEFQVGIKYPFGRSQKRISDAAGKRLLPKELIGILPLVTLSPDDKELTAGSPDSRRSYIDRILSQTSKSYLRDILEFRKVLKNRNKILSDYKNEYSVESGLLALWTEKFIELSAKIIIKRYSLLNEMNPLFQSYYKEFAPETEQVLMEYRPDKFSGEEDSLDGMEDEDVKRIYRKNAERLETGEKARGTSLFGPQRDDINLLINGMASRESASQGQHKSLMIALKFTEFVYLENNTENHPIVILDDIFSELDKKRAHKVLEMLSEFGGQVFISSTDELSFDAATLNSACIYDVNGGHAERRQSI